MDCIDCHNRPGHNFDASADKAVNRGLAMGMIPRELPFIKREATAALTESYASRPMAEEKIAQRLRGLLSHQLQRRVHGQAAGRRARGGRARRSFTPGTSSRK
jgi:hypothetical protein